MNGFSIYKFLLIYKIFNIRGALLKFLTGFFACFLRVLWCALSTESNNYHFHFVVLTFRCLVLEVNLVSKLGFGALYKSTSNLTV